MRDVIEARYLRHGNTVIRDDGTQYKINNVKRGALMIQVRDTNGVWHSYLNAQEITVWYG